MIGPNGAGKTTLFKMITGQEKPDAGKIDVGTTVKLGYVDQSRDALDPNATVWQEVSGGNDIIYFNKREINSRAYCAAFAFKGPDQQKKVGTLSGGERNRVHLARTLKGGANVLLLDEPTNDLDMETLRALEDALEDYAGCAVIISHDRWFLNRIATHILAFEGDSHVEWFEGNFSDLRGRQGPAASGPIRSCRRRSSTSGSRAERARPRRSVATRATTSIERRRTPRRRRGRDRPPVRRQVSGADARLPGSLEASRGPARSRGRRLPKWETAVRKRRTCGGADLRRAARPPSHRSRRERASARIADRLCARGRTGRQPVAAVKGRRIAALGTDARLPDPVGHHLDREDRVRQAAEARRGSPRPTSRCPIRR